MRLRDCPEGTLLLLEALAINDLELARKIAIDFNLVKDDIARKKQAVKVQFIYSVWAPGHDVKTFINAREAAEYVRVPESTLSSRMRSEGVFRKSIYFVTREAASV